MSTMENRPRELALREVHDNPNQPRFAMNEEVIAGARAAMDEAGAYPVAMALTVRERAAGGFEIIAGHHRARAAREAGLELVWAYVQELDDRQAAIALATTNNQASMTPLEHARHALWLEEQHGVTAEDYARLVGKSIQAVEQAITALRVLEDHGGITGPNAEVSIVALSALANVDDDAQRASLLFQFRQRRTTGLQARQVIQDLRDGLGMRAAFDRAEGRDDAPPTKPRVGAYATNPAGQAGDAAAVAAVRLNQELVAGYEWTLALYQARSEELEARFGQYLGDGFADAVALRQKRILRELRADPKARLLQPADEAAGCATCAHGRESTFSDIGWSCAASRAGQCQPLTLKKFWVAREGDKA